MGVRNCWTNTPTNPAWKMYVEKNERKTMMREKTKQTSWITNTTKRITLSNLRYSQNVLISRSTTSNEICTNKTDLYLLNDNFILRVFYLIDCIEIFLLSRLHHFIVRVFILSCFMLQYFLFILIALCREKEYHTIFSLVQFHHGIL